MSATYYFIPAQPGHYELTGRYESFTAARNSLSTNLIFSRRPVIAWKIADDLDSSHSATPVTVDSDKDPQDAPFWAVEYPNGQVTEVYSDVAWQSESDWRLEATSVSRAAGRIRAAA